MGKQAVNLKKNTGHKISGIQVEVPCDSPILLTSHGNLCNFSCQKKQIHSSVENEIKTLYLHHLPISICLRSTDHSGYIKQIKTVKLWGQADTFLPTPVILCHHF
jgi:hypothetical protein